MDECKISTMVYHHNAIKMLKRYGTSTKYCTTAKEDRVVTLVAFADTSHTIESSQLCYLVGIVYGKMRKKAIFYVSCWASHKSRRPTKSTPAAVILAASEGVGEIVQLKYVLEKIYGQKVNTMIIVDSKDLYKSL